MFIMETDPIKIETVKVVLYGLWGLGKTSIACTASKPVTLDFEGGAHRSKYRKTLCRFPNGFSVAKTNDFFDELKKFDTIVIDTPQAMVAAIEQHLIDSRKDNVKYAASSHQRKRFGDIKDEAQRFLNRLFNLQKDIIFICHTKEITEADGSPLKQPQITGSTYDFIMQNSDFVGLVSISNGKTVIDFSPGEGAVGKNSAKFPQIEVTDFDRDPYFFAGILQKMKDAINAGTQEVQRIKMIAESYKDQVRSVSNVDEFNYLYELAIVELEKLPNAFKNEIKAAMKQRGAEIEVTFDKALNKWVNIKKTDVEKKVDEVKSQTADEWGQDYEGGANHDQHAV